MGAWGTGNLENDTAADWIADLSEGGDADDVRAALRKVLDAEGYVEAPEACEALAAAEVVAAARGAAGPPEDAEDAIAVAERMPELADDALLALGAIGVVLDPERSELYDLWKEAEGDGPDSEWLTVVADLRRRLA
jgi:hypothetical protein